MSSLKVLRQRIASIKSIKKITSAMKMVAISKFRKCEESLEYGSQYLQGLYGMLEDTIRLRADEDQLPLLLTGRPGEKHLLIVFSTDKGLCGSFNTVILQKTLAEITQLKQQGKKVILMSIGHKLVDALPTRLKDKVKFHENFVLKDGFKPFESLALTLKILYDAQEFDTCSCIFSRFQSLMSYEIEVRSLVPLEPLFTQAVEKTSLFETDPSPKDIIPDLVLSTLAASLYYGFLETRASEESARMMAMENATRNADDMVEELQIVYNRTRQALITRELSEIIAGARAV